MLLVKGLTNLMIAGSLATVFSIGCDPSAQPQQVSGCPALDALERRVIVVVLEQHPEIAKIRLSFERKDSNGDLTGQWSAWSKAANGFSEEGWPFRGRHVLSSDSMIIDLAPRQQDGKVEIG